MKSNQAEQITNLKIASLWIRLLAQFIDGVIMGVIMVPILSLVAFYIGNNFTAEDPGGLSLFIAILILFPWFYSTLFEGGKNGATPGKQILKIKVVNAEQQRINFSIATIRFFTKYILGIIIIGWIIAFFNEKRQGLHDKIAGTLVVIR